MSTIKQNNDIAVIGAGLVGSLLSVYLARRGINVQVFERRPDMRKQSMSAGRSINLNISERGFNALRRIGLEEEARKLCIPMTGRMIHSVNGDLTYQPYGRDESEFGNSISRAELNKLLMNHAEKSGQVQIAFNHKAESIDFAAGQVHLSNQTNGQRIAHHCRIVMATDGATSAIRDHMMSLPGFQSCESSLDYGYKELLIPAGMNGSFQIEKNALHIWPRGTYMLIALPNLDGSFTCTLFLPWKGPLSFEALDTEQQVVRFFEQRFGDALPLMEHLPQTFFQNPTGHMLTVKCNPWNAGGQAVLLGDAAHSIVPFFGQGMNCGFEDVAVLDQCLEQYLKQSGNVDWQVLFNDFVARRKDNCDAIADMAVENFIEMRDKVADPQFQLQKGVERILQKEFPGQYLSRYSLVTFTNIPYRAAQQAGLACDEILAQLCSGMDKPEQVDLSKASQLIASKLAPILKEYPKEIPASRQTLVT